jgi:nicotinamide-nucleotide amidase
MVPDDQRQRAARLIGDLKAQRVKLATAESCTGGLIVALLTEIPGSSAVVDRGFVTYSNEAKAEMVGVRPDLIATHGAVSREVAIAMAEGALVHSEAAIAVAVTGVAGPGGATAAKPVGLVHIAAARTGTASLHEEYRFGDISRGAIRLAAVERAIALVERQVANATQLADGHP